MITISGSYDPTSATAGHGDDGTGRAVPQAVATFAASVAAMPRPGSHRASPGTGDFRRAESSITIELA
jgi:hypothetical protein